ncbi:MAG: LysM peptidoglycan-binding domain-containing protein [Micromonosporaceae bacterium]|nr:LysM peptidoglycan-binding domain-containing protein [Micromonosporaceae bacterium]
MARNGGGVGRVFAGLSALLVLAAVVGGLPLLLLKVAGPPWPSELPALPEIWDRLTGPDNGSLFLGALTLVAWVAWATFVLAVLVEIPAQLRGRRTVRLPGLGLQQRLAAVLVAAIVSLVVSPAVSAANPTPVQAGPPAAPVPAVAMADTVHSASPAPPASAAEVHRAPASSAASAGAVQSSQRSFLGRMHEVQLGESLLSVAEHYGVSWEFIAEANYGRPQPDGRSLQPGQQRVYPGWTLLIPGVPSESAQQTYEIVRGDWLGYVAERYLGDFDRYPEIAQLNQEIIADPDHIEPGWQVALPSDAYDRGVREHATGVATAARGPDARDPGTVGSPPDTGGTGTVGPTPTPQPTPKATPPPQPSATPPPQPSATPTPQPTPTAPATPAATGVPSAPHSEPSNVAALDDGDLTEESEMDRIAIAFGAAGLLAALVLAAVVARRRKGRQHHTPGRRPVTPAEGRVETELRVAQRPLDVERLELALRSLASSLADRAGDLPDPAAVVVAGGDVQLLLAATCPNPPVPWQDYGDSWVLPAAAQVVAVPEQLAPLPALAAIGSHRDIHLLIDLERVGVIIVTGEPDARADLIRYVASELALNAWSDDIEVTLAGLPNADAKPLVELNPDRIRATNSVTEAIARTMRRVTTARTTLQHAGIADALAGRIGDVAADTWMPHVLVVFEPDEAGLAALRELIDAMNGASRCGVAVVVALPPEAPRFGRWTVTVAPDKTLRLPFPLPYPTLTAAGLPRPELVRLAEIMSAARSQSESLIPPAPEPEPWAQGTDAAGSLLEAPDDAPEEDTIRIPLASPSEPPAGPDGDTKPKRRITVTAAIPAEEPRPRTITAAIRQRERQADPRLDADLRAWRDQDPTVPRISILGPVEVAAPGPEPEQRKLFHAEIIVYLAQRGARGADRDRLDEALWPDRQVKDASRRVAITRARRWLGETPDGEPWLPDMGPDRTYRLRPGYLLDWHLFRRLRTRGEAHGPAGVKDLRRALELVRGVPLDGADRQYAAGGRNPYTWLAESDINPEHITAAIVDTAHLLAKLYLEVGDTAGARWAVARAWLADPARTYDQPWRDLMTCQHRDRHEAELRATFAELMRVRDAEVPEDLDPDTFQLVLELLPTLVRAAAK